MHRLNLIKIFCIAGFICGEIYNVLVMAAPNLPGARIATRMWVPAESIPRDPAIPPGTPPPASHVAKRIMIGALFMGPFGAMAGLGIGLLAEGVRQKLRGKEAPPKTQ